MRKEKQKDKKERLAELLVKTSLSAEEKLEMTALMKDERLTEYKKALG